MSSRSSFLALALSFFVCSAPLAAQELPEFTFNVDSAIVSLPFRIVDAEFSTSLNAIVAVSESPNQLHIYRPDTNDLVSVNLELPPTCVSVSPDGHTAVAGHDAWVSHVDLDEAVLVQTIPVSTVVSDIVMGSGGWAYIFSPGSFDAILSINLDTDAYSESLGSVYGGTIARLHPSGTTMYGADRSVSPADIRKFPISEEGLAVVGNDSPYHGDYLMCGNLWFSADGGRIYTPCGNVFRSSTDPSQDMRYVGSFSKPVDANWIAHTLAGNNLAVVPELAPSSNGEVRYFTPDFLLYRGAAVLPRFADGEDTWAAGGRWIFFNAAGTKQYVVVQADSASGMTNDFGLVTIDCTNPSLTLAPENASFSRSFTTAQFGVTGSPGCGWKSVSSVPWINTNSSGVGDGTVTYTVSANPGTEARSGTITVGNATFTVQQAGIPAPVSLAATATSPTTVSLTWSPDASHHHYEVWRNSGAGFALIATPATPGFSDATAANTAHVYKVRGITSDGGVSPFSAPDYAHTFTLTDPVLSAGMRIRASHVTELRTVVNAIRAAAGLGAVTFGDPSLSGVLVKRVHTTALHDAINATRTSLGMVPVAFAPIEAKSTVRASIVESVRTSLR